jgi:hypothetical protein
LVFSFEPALPGLVRWQKQAGMPVAMVKPAWQASSFVSVPGDGAGQVGGRVVIACRIACPARQALSGQVQRQDGAAGPLDQDAHC